MDLKLDLIYKKKDVVGIDIGSTSIKAVQLKKRGRLVKLIGYGSCPTPADAIKDGVITDPKMVAESITKLLSQPKMGHTTAKRIASSLPETKIFTRIIKLPEMTKKELNEAALWEVDQYVPTPTEELYFDWQIVAHGKDTKGNIEQEVMIVAVPKKIVDSYLEVFKIAGLEIFSLEMSLSAISRAMVSNKKQNEIFLLADIGGEATNIAIYDQNLRVTGSIPVGSSALYQSLSGKAGLDAKKTTDLISRCETGNKDACKTFLDAVSGNIDTIVDEIKKLIKYYSELKGESIGKIEKTLVCGGLASLPGLVEEIGNRIDLKAEIGNPWTNISIYPLKSIPRKETVMYTNAVGLALKGLENE